MPFLNQAISDQICHLQRQDFKACLLKHYASAYAKRKEKKRVSSST